MVLASFPEEKGYSPKTKTTLSGSLLKLKRKAPWHELGSRFQKPGPVNWDKAIT